MRKETKAMKDIKFMVDGLNLDGDALAEKSALLLKSYRAVVWATAGNARYMEETAEEIFGKRELGAALAYLSDFAPEDERGEFEGKVKGLFEAQWLVELLDEAMVRVREYPHNGRLYFDILTLCYLGAYNYTEQDVLDMCHLERSVYYDRRREAVMLLGVALWGQAIPKYQKGCNIKKYRKNRNVKNLFDNLNEFEEDEDGELERFVG